MKMRVCADGQRGGRCRVIGDLFRSFAHAFAGRSMLPSLSHQSRCFGVGLSEAQRNRTKYFYDANGDVGQLVDSTLTTASIQAKYEYYPFGGILVSTGTYANTNPFKFSTKYRDNESSLYSYPYRYLIPRLGRWLNRDPIGEMGGINLYAAMGSDPVDRIDPLGRNIIGPLIGLVKGLCLIKKCCNSYEDNTPFVDCEPKFGGTCGTDANGMSVCEGTETITVDIHCRKDNKPSHCTVHKH